MAERQEIKVLYVEDNPGDFKLVQEMLSDPEHRAFATTDFNLTWAECFKDGVDRLQEGRYSLILLDLSLPDAKGLESFYSMRAIASDIPIIVLSDLKDENVAVEAVQSGAQDYLVKEGISTGVLMRAIKYAIERYINLINLSNAKETAIRAEREKNDLLFSIGMEIRNFVNGIIGLTDLALKAEDKPELQKDYVQGTADAAFSMMGIINNTLDFSRIEAGELEIRRRTFSLRDSLGTLKAPIEHPQHRSSLAITCSVDDDVPDTLVGDPLRMNQVITDFISHAIRFGEIEESIVVSVELDNSTDTEVSLHLTVPISLREMSISQQQLIFESLAQADASTARKYGTLGLGLAVTARIIKLMGGRVWLQSEKGGNSFHFSLTFEREGSEKIN